MDDFLNNSVYYPCSKFHRKPLEILGKLCPNFLYADDGVDRGEVEKVCHEEPPCGYHPVHFEELEPAELHLGDFQFVRRDPPYEGINIQFVAHSHFERLPDFSDAHGPNQIILIFTGGEGVRTYESVYNLRGIAPTCLVHIRPGMAFDRNYCDYPKSLADAMGANQADLPKYLLIDEAGCNSSFGDYLRTVVHYTPLRYWTDYRSYFGNSTLYIFAVRQPAPKGDELEGLLQILPDGIDCIDTPWTKFQTILEQQRSRRRI